MSGVKRLSKKEISLLFLKLNKRADGITQRCPLNSQLLGARAKKGKIPRKKDV